MVIVFFDADCSLCSNFVNWVRGKSSRKEFQFVSIGSPECLHLFMSNGFEYPNSDSVLVIKSGKLYQKSDAIIEIVDTMGNFYKIFILIKWIPRFFRDFLYDQIAKYRYLIWGGSRVCAISKPSDQINNP